MFANREKQVKTGTSGFLSRLMRRNELYASPVNNKKCETEHSGLVWANN